MRRLDNMTVLIRNKRMQNRHGQVDWVRMRRRAYGSKISSRTSRFIACHRSNRWLLFSRWEPIKIGNRGHLSNTFLMTDVFPMPSLTKCHRVSPRSDLEAAQPCPFLLIFFSANWRDPWLSRAATMTTNRWTCARHTVQSSVPRRNTRLRVIAQKITIVFWSFLRNCQNISNIDTCVVEHKVSALVDSQSQTPMDKGWGRVASGSLTNWAATEKLLHTIMDGNILDFGPTCSSGASQNGEETVIETTSRTKAITSSDFASWSRTWESAVN